MTRGRYRTIWLSDMHLGTRGCQAQALVELLDGHDCEHLYLVGHIIDFWRLRRSIKNRKAAARGPKDGQQQL